MKTPAQRPRWNWHRVKIKKDRNPELQRYRGLPATSRSQPWKCTSPGKELFKRPKLGIDTSTQGWHILHLVFLFVAPPILQLQYGFLENPQSIPIPKRSLGSLKALLGFEPQHQEKVRIRDGQLLRDTI